MSDSEEEQEEDDENLPVDGERKPSIGNKAPKFIVGYCQGVIDAELRKRMAVNVRMSPICQKSRYYIWNSYGLIRFICGPPPHTPPTRLF